MGGDQKHSQKQQKHQKRFSHRHTHHAEDYFDDVADLVEEWVEPHLKSPVQVYPMADLAFLYDVTEVDSVVFVVCQDS